MTTMLSMNDIEELVARQAKQFDSAMTRDRVHVYEDLHPLGDEDILIVQISARAPEDRNGWIERQVRVSQGIRDALLERGDERYPIIELFEPEDWAIRND